MRLVVSWAVGVLVAVLLLMGMPGIHASSDDDAGVLYQAQVHFLHGGDAIYPEYRVLVKSQPSTHVLGYEIKEYLVQIQARSSVPYSNVLARLDRGSWLNLAATLHTPSGPDGATISVGFAGIGRVWSTTSVPLSATEDFPLTADEFSALAGQETPRLASPSGAISPMGKGRGGGQPCPTCIPGKYNGYVFGWDLTTGGDYGQKDAFLTVRYYKNDPADFWYYGFTNSRGYFQIDMTTLDHATRFLDFQVRYKGGADCYVQCLWNRVFGPLIGSEVRDWDPAAGMYLLWYVGVNHLRNLTGYLDVARAQLNSNVYGDVSQYIETELSYAQYSGVTNEGSWSLAAGGGIKYGSGELGFKSDWSDSWTNIGITGPATYRRTAAITYADQYLHWVSDLSGNIYSSFERNPRYAIPGGGLVIAPSQYPETIDARTAYNRYLSNDHTDPASQRFKGSDINAAELGYTLKTVKVQTDHSKSDTWSVDLRVGSFVYGKFNYRTTKTTTNGDSFSISVRTYARIPVDSNDAQGRPFDVLVWMSDDAPMLVHVYLIPPSW